MGRFRLNHPPTPTEQAARGPDEDEEDQLIDDEEDNHVEKLPIPVKEPEPAISSASTPKPRTKKPTGKGGRKSKAPTDEAKPPVDVETSDTSTMMAAWRVDVPQASQPPSAPTPPPTKKRKRTAKPKDSTPGETLPVPPPQKRKPK